VEVHVCSDDRNDPLGEPGAFAGPRQLLGVRSCTPAACDANCHGMLCYDSICCHAEISYLQTKERAQSVFPRAGNTTFDLSK